MSGFQQVLNVRFGEWSEGPSLPMRTPPDTGPAHASGIPRGVRRAEPPDVRLGALA